MAEDPLSRPEPPRPAWTSSPSQLSAPTRSRQVFWLALTLAICTGFALRASRPALVNPLIIHDDVRQHVFWVPRLHDPSLFQNDWIADYYQSQAPPGYQAVYWLMTLAMDDVVASKLLPILLSTVLTLAAFWLGWSLWRRLDAAALGTILLLWTTWQYDDVASATPRAYAQPLLVLQLAALASGRWRLALLLLPIQALFYPLGCALAVLMIGLWIVWRTAEDTGFTPQPPFTAVGAGTRLAAWTLHAFRHALPRLICLSAVTVLALVLVGLGELDAARYGPVVSASVARTMPEFQPGGRASYFLPDPYKFWIESSRSGFALGPKDTWIPRLPALTLPFVLALVLGCWLVAGRLGWTGRPTVPRSGILLIGLTVVSLGLFGAAHVLLFALYLPARYVQFSLPVVWALAGGLGWILLGERIAARVGQWLHGRPGPGVAAHGAPSSLAPSELAALAGIGLLTLHAPPPGDYYVTGRHPAIYAYLRQTPPSTLVGALPADSNILPVFGLRGVLTSFEHALPYQPGYYAPLRERTEAFRAAYFAPTLAPLIQVIHQQGVGIVIADAEVLERRRRSNREHPPALERALDRCGLLRERDLVVVSVSCLEAAQAAAVSP